MKEGNEDVFGSTFALINPEFSRDVFKNTKVSVQAVFINVIRMV